MKKIIITSIFLIISIPCFSQNTGAVDALIREGLDKNFTSIQREARSLNEFERNFIYNQHEKDWLVGGAVNLVPPLFFFLPNFGIGNFIQGDNAGGAITLVGGTTGYVLGWVGIAGMIAANDDNVPSWALATTIGGFISFYAFSAFGVVRALLYPNSYNKKLKGVLYFSQASTYDVLPEFYVTKNKSELTLIRIRF